MAVSPPAAVLGIKAPDFTLPGIDGRTYRLAELKGKKGTVVVFTLDYDGSAGTAAQNFTLLAVFTEG